MMEQLTIGIQSLQQFSRFVTALALIIPALFWLLFADRKKAASRGCGVGEMRSAGWLALITLLLLTAPVTSGFITKLLNGRALSRCFLIVPVVLIAAFAVTECVSYYQITKLSIRRKIVFFACMALLTLASVSSPWKFASDGFGVIHNAQKIDADLLEICDVVQDDHTLLPPAMKAQLGEFDNNVDASRTRYRAGRPRAIAYSAAKDDCRYVVVTKADSEITPFKEWGYTKFKSAGSYVIYKR